MVNSMVTGCMLFVLIKAFQGWGSVGPRRTRYVGWQVITGFDFVYGSLGVLICRSGTSFRIGCGY